MTNFLSASDPGYDTERTGYNRSVDHKPEVVVPAASVDDVVAAVRYATAHGLGVAVQATGHGPARGADGVLVNTSRMDGITIDPVARTARVEAGVRGGALVRAAAEHGLAPLNGSSPEVGVVSYHLGGGIGMLGRSLGWAVDHVRALEVVTADGVLRRASATEETDLFWALRGGGKGTLGVVTALEIDLHPVARLYGGGMHFAAADAERVLTTWAEWTRTAPEEMGSSVLLIRMPDLPFLPDVLRGRHVVHVRFAFTGSAEEGERLVRPFRDLGPVTDTVAEMPYAAVGSIHAEPTTPVPFHARNTMPPPWPSCCATPGPTRTRRTWSSCGSWAARSPGRGRCPARSPAATARSCCTRARPPSPTGCPRCTRRTTGCSRRWRRGAPAGCA
jgi:FAD/FMN-containing dehydrogenase